MLTFATIAPHSPLLIPTVGKENIDKLAKTIEALADLEGDFYQSQIDTVVIITPHGPVHEEAFVINFSPRYKGQLKDFGDFSTKKEYTGDNELSYKIKESLETTAPLQLHTDESLDYGCVVPLYFLAAHCPKINIIPISCSGLSYKAHFDFGESIIKTLSNSPKNIALIASADLSHKLNKKSPDGYSPKAKKFDQKLIEDLEKKNTENILNLQPKEVANVSACGIRSIAVLLGAIANINYQPELLSYEGPFGVGYMVMKMRL